MYTVFKAEYQQSIAERKPYNRTPLEWELLGDLCMRLGYADDAKDCYQLFVDARFTFRVWVKLLNIYLDEGKAQLVLNACEKLVCVLDRWKWGEMVVGSFEG